MNTKLLISCLIFILLNCDNFTPAPPPPEELSPKTCHDHPIFTTNNIRDILSYIDKNTLVVFDMDQTLIMDPQHAGNVKFNISKLAFVEPDTKTVLEEIDNTGAKIIGLTARGYYSQDKDDAGLRLRELGYHLQCPWLDDTPYKKINKNITNFKLGYKNCIFYTNFTPKNILLSEFLNTLKKYNIKIDKVIFVDDSLEHTKNISKSMKEQNINSCVFNYRRAFSEQP